MLDTCSLLVDDCGGLLRRLHIASMWPGIDIEFDIAATSFSRSD
jgi:hypothetical protein